MGNGEASRNEGCGRVGTYMGAGTLCTVGSHSKQLPHGNNYMYSKLMLGSLEPYSPTFSKLPLKSELQEVVV